MAKYEIFRLRPRDFRKCGNIWNIKKQRKGARRWYREVRAGKRVTFIYAEQGEFLGEGSLVLENGDPDYTIPGRRVYLSRMIVTPEAQGHGIGGILLDYLVEQARQWGYQEIALGIDVGNARARHLYEKKGFDKVIFEGEDQYGKFIKLLKIL